MYLTIWLRGMLKSAFVVFSLSDQSLHCQPVSILAHFILTTNINTRLNSLSNRSDFTLVWNQNLYRLHSKSIYSFFFIFQRISCESSAKQTIYMKYWVVISLQTVYVCGGGGYTIFTLSICPYVCLFIITFWFLLFILLNNLSEGSQYLAWVSKKLCLLMLLVFSEKKKSQNVACCCCDWCFKG